MGGQTLLANHHALDRRGTETTNRAEDFHLACSWSVAEHSDLRMGRGREGKREERERGFERVALFVYSKSINDCFLENGSKTMVLV